MHARKWEMVVAAEGEYIYDGCVLTNVSIEKVERPRGGRFVLMIVCFHF